MQSTIMKNFLMVSLVAAVVSLPVCVSPISASGQDHPMGHMHEGMQGMKGMEGMKHPEKMPPLSSLKPAEGASVKILSPHPGQVFNSDEVPLEYKFAKGKRGSHIHAYMDGQLMGMFSDPNKGTLTGIQPGSHTLELRVTTADHKTELNARDVVKFTVK